MLSFIAYQIDLNIYIISEEYADFVVIDGDSDARWKIMSDKNTVGKRARRRK